MVSRDGYVSTEEEKRRKEQRLQAAVRVVWYAEKNRIQCVACSIKKKLWLYSKRSIYEKFHLYYKLKLICVYVLRLKQRLEYIYKFYRVLDRSLSYLSSKIKLVSSMFDFFYNKY